MQAVGATARPTNLPGPGEARPSLHQPRSKGRGAYTGKPSRGSLHRASFHRQVQEQAVIFPDDRIDPASGLLSLSEKAPPRHFALEEETKQKFYPEHPPTQLDLVQLRAEIAHLHEIVQQLAGKSFSKQRAELAANGCKQTNNNNNNNNNNSDNNNSNTTNTTNNNNDDNNYNNNNKRGRESGLNNLDLDNDNPESEPDLDAPSLGSFNPTLGVESSLRSLDQHEAHLSLENLGHKTMTIGFSLGSLIQQKQDGQEGMTIQTAWDPSLDPSNDKRKKKVTFSKATLEAYKARSQNNRQQSSQLRQLEHNTEKQELPEQNNKRTTAQTCWNQLQQEQKMQQQLATASRGEDELRPNQNSSLDSVEESLGNLESQTQTQQACRSPKHNNNTSSLGIGTKNTAAWGILIDTGAAISLAPMSLAQNIELSPLEGTLQLRSVTGEAIEAFGRRTVQLVGSNLSFHVSFVIANVQHALLGMDAFQPKGHLLYIEACPKELGFSICRGSSLPGENGSLLDDKGRTQEEATSSSGGACETSFLPGEP